MSTTVEPPAGSPGDVPSATTPTGAGRSGRIRSKTSLLANGQPAVWLTGGALAVCLFMIVTLLLVVIYQGMATFWPGAAIEVRLLDGKTVLLGEVVRTESYRPDASAFDFLPADQRAVALARVAAHDGNAQRRLLRTGNFELTQKHYDLVTTAAVAEESQPEWALVIERLTTDGRFYGFPTAVKIDGQVAATDPAEVWALFNEYHPAALKRWEKIESIGKHNIGATSRRVKQADVMVAAAVMKYGKGSPQVQEAEAQRDEIAAEANKEQEKWTSEIAALNKDNSRYLLVLTTASGQTPKLKLSDVLRAYPANQLGWWGKLQIYLARWWEFLTAEPRNANSEGGVFPAIFGTMTMTVLMTIGVVPFGVLAALYLREYARAGVLVSAVRIAINNLAGVPSIVFGVFGLGFFCYIVGGGIDSLFFSVEKEQMKTPTFGKPGILWASLTLALLTLPVVIVATEEALAGVPRSMREGSFACGASKWQTIWRIVLPRTMPGILTGMILAMARGAGEVAPLMLVGAAKIAPDLAVDGVFPYIHADRSFLHLGFQVLDVGFQSQNSEAAKPMVFSLTLLLICLVALLNVAAMWLRSRLRRRFVAGHF